MTTTKRPRRPSISKHKVEGLESILSRTIPQTDEEILAIELLRDLMRWRVEFYEWDRETYRS